ncbi:MAG: class I tRNA ligase family protein [Bryobacteraceae bacterium]
MRKVSEDFESRWHFNTSIAAVMELVNELYANEDRITPPVLAEVCHKLTLLLGPFAPYMTQDLWEEQGQNGPVFRQPWPQYDEDLAREDGADIVLQVNGKLRSRMTVPFGTSSSELERLAKADDKIQTFLAGKQIVKIVAVPDKLVNLVVKG